MLHQLNHAHWAEVHEDHRAVAAVEDGVPNWKDAPPIVLATKDEVRSSKASRVSRLATSRGLSGPVRSTESGR